MRERDSGQGPTAVLKSFAMKVLAFVCEIGAFNRTTLLINALTAAIAVAMCGNLATTTQGAGTLNETQLSIHERLSSGTITHADLCTSEATVRNLMSTIPELVMEFFVEGNMRTEQANNALASAGLPRV